MKSVVRSVKLTKPEDSAIRKAATKAGLPWSTWAREVLLRAAGSDLTMASRVEQSVVGISGRDR